MTTPRLEITHGLLRPWMLSDAPTLVEAWADPDIARWNSVPAIATLATASSWISGVEDRAKARTSIDWVIESEAAARVVGEVGLSGFNAEHRGALIGYWLLPVARGQGLAANAVSAITHWAHTTFHLDTIVARCHTSNMASQHVAARCGYRNERLDSTGQQLWVSRTRET